ncbi:LacI family DNA-binding transcriptional regulator [Heyndrickxia faecalis]|uniref:LacI family DNA-binding transcriptional regulator n=1 Tax=Heyndrickxia TaxID=2837504 RepID=UPI000D73962C|nr:MULTISPECIES: LacI family DNA-binding transcriptional regulator [Heyndrickxia]AWP36510.1 LacI family transcriptional regulator [Heyndrickxia coagulans]MED4868116.1 LacI family DNA-binding transcriptional regulator [Weizmannia sp. CD-2023]
MTTIRDIAKKANVSVSTASRALNNNPRISVKTRQRIQAIAAAEGYMPNYNAKNLTLGEANVVGVVFPAAENNVQGNPFYIDILRGINKQLAPRHYVLSVAIGDHTEQVFENVKSMVEQAKVKRFILLYSYAGDPVTEYLRKKALRFVIIGEPVEDKNDFYVDNNNYQAGIAGTEYLLGHLGAKHPVFIESSHEWPYERSRREGFQAAILRRGVSPLIYRLQKENNDGITEEFIRQHPEIDSIMATDDMIGFEFYHHWQCAHPGKSIPAVSFNHSFILQLADHQFHSINLFPENLGSAAVELLFTDKENKGGEEPPRKIILPFEIS